MVRTHKQKSRAGKAGDGNSRGHQEVEVKLRIADRAAFLGRLAELGAVATGPRVHEMNTLFDSPDGRLASAGQMARVRVERPAVAGGKKDKSAIAKRGDGVQSQDGSVATLTYKGPPGTQEDGYKEREEHEVRIGNASVLEGLCRLLGLRPWFRYEKYRSAYALPGIKGVELDFDETPVGDYLELEGDRASIDRAARLLGFGKGDYIVKSYGGLYMESRGIRGEGPVKGEPAPNSGVPDMLFGKAGAKPAFAIISGQQGSSEQKRRSSGKSAGKSSKNKKIKKI